MERWYLVRYGARSLVGRFPFLLKGGIELQPGDPVVVRSHRGTELGAIVAGSATPPEGNLGGVRVLRRATDEDVTTARRVEADRDRRFLACARIFADGIWPIDVIDVEPLLDENRTVIQYLGPHHLDVDGLLATVRAACDLDVRFEPVGLDLSDEESDEHAEPAEAGDPTGAHTSGGCGNGGCGNGGCGSPSGEAGEHGGSGGCSDCGVKKLLAARR